MALHLYGSIEGVIDLLMNNPLLSFETTLSPGDDLIYTDGFVINADVLNNNRMHGIVPANGERNVYPKTAPGHLNTLSIELVVSREENSSGFVFGGNGEIAVDWGDNSPIETIRLSYAPRYYHHSFDNKTPNRRMIRVYNGNTILEADFSLTKAQHIYCLEAIAIEKLTLNNGESSLEFVSNLPDMYSIDLTGHKIGSLLPLLANKKLMEVDLTDMEMMESCVQNLIKNALKYTQEGFVKFGAYVTDNVLYFYVTDSGIGIAENDKEILFDRFRQMDNSLSHDGVGLGLNLVKGLINLLDGEIELESEPGKGSTFSFSVPLFNEESEEA